MRRLLCLLVPFGLLSCGYYYPEVGSDAGALPDPSAARSPRFRSLADAALHGRLALHPVEATALGVHDHDDRLDDLRPEALAARVESLRKHLFRLGALDPASLDGPDRVDAALLEERLRADLARAEGPLNPVFYRELIGEGLLFLLVLDGIPVDRRLAALGGRLEQIPGLLATAKLTGSYPGAADEFRAIADFLKSGFSARVPQGGDAGLRRRMDEARVHAAESLAVFAAGLAKSAGASNPGLGETALSSRLRYEEGIEAAPGDLLKAELAAIEGFRAELEGLPKEARGGTQGDGDPVRVLSALLPGVTVAPAPAFEAFRARAMLRMPGPFDDTSTRASLLVALPAATPPELELLAVSVRASLELAGARRTAATPIRKALAVRSALDGWALYGELRGVEEGKAALGRTRIERALQASARAAAAIRIHASGVAEDDAAALLGKEAGLDPASAVFEARRAAADPGVLLASWGLREILALRTAWRARTGRSNRDFDEAFLKAGPLPLPLARRLLLGTP